MAGTTQRWARPQNGEAPFWKKLIPVAMGRSGRARPRPLRNQLRIAQSYASRAHRNATRADAGLADEAPHPSARGSPERAFRAGHRRARGPGARGEVRALRHAPVAELLPRGLGRGVGAVLAADAAGLPAAPRGAGGGAARGRADRVVIAGRQLLAGGGPPHADDLGGRKTTEMAACRHGLPRGAPTSGNLGGHRRRSSSNAWRDPLICAAAHRTNPQWHICLAMACPHKDVNCNNKSQRGVGSGKNDWNNIMATGD